MSFSYEIRLLVELAADIFSDLEGQRYSLFRRRVLGRFILAVTFGAIASHGVPPGEVRRGSPPGKSPPSARRPPIQSAAAAAEAGGGCRCRFHTDSTCQRTLQRGLK